jgi:type IV pilus biogenesis protein CpaD/CtpE
MKTLVSAALMALAAGCAREHLTETHGRATRELFAVQRANPGAPRGPEPKALTGLDSQEATIIADTYRRSLAPEDTRVEEPGMLLLEPQSNRERQRPLAPSVPPTR